MTSAHIFQTSELEAVPVESTAHAPWDHLPQFVGKLTVQPAHLDEFGHTNNTIYLAWMQAVAALHSRHLGLTFEDYVALGYGCVARQHHMLYKQPTYQGDTLWLGTWISQNDGKADMVRQYQFVRESDLATVMQGHTQWVCIDMKTGRPKRQPPKFVDCYRAVQAG
ncbi:acyl-CoA thioesterase [Limnobacter sp.]|uniref:acyl-CoA thioesterase n=1 Tax=Limnobacter sp. TaxID=2003368 RepID=UPI0035111E59